MAEPRRIRKVVILGRDESLWLAANVLSQAFNKADMDITAIEVPSVLRHADVFPTLRAQEAFHSVMGVDEAALLRASQSTFSLGQRFSNWAKTKAPFFHVYSTYGTPIDRVHFQHFWVKARAAGLKADYDEFSIAVTAAKQGRFFVPDDSTDGFAVSDYAYNLGAAAYCQVLKQLAVQRGVQHMTGRLAEARQDDEGNITSLLLTNGQVVEGDFFIDASGGESLLIGGALGVAFQSWGKWFPCDRVLTAFAPAFSPLPSFSQVSAFRSGWAGLFPLQDRTAVQQVYSSVDMNEQQAYEAAGMVTSLRLNSDPTITPFVAGTRASAWAKNCVGIGEATVVMDPVDNVRVHTNLIGLSHLVSLFPVDSDMRLERDEYNRNVASSLARIRDYQICHYKLNQRFDQPLWDHCRAMPLPDELAYKLELFEARGVLAVYDDETFQEDEWISMFIGHGVIPRTYDPLVDQVPEADVIRRFQQILGFIRMNVEQMKPMEAFLSPRAMTGAMSSFSM